MLRPHAAWAENDPDDWIRGVQWLVANQQGVPVGQRTYPAWRSYSLNVDREHGGERGEAWPRLFMSDAATAFAVLALAAAD